MKGENHILKKINESKDILWISFPALEKFDFLHQGLILKNKSENLFSDRTRLKKDLAGSLKTISGHKGVNLYANQVHKNRCAIFKSPSDIRNWDFTAEYDSFITNQKNVCLTVRVADCLPIYLVEPEARIIGLIHAGWRSTLLRIIDSTLEQMQVNFDVEISNLRAVIGPGLGPNCFEISEELAILFPPESVLSENNRRPKLDLTHVNLKQLLKSGVAPNNIAILPECTHCNPLLYHSFRRTADKNQRMVAFMGLKG